MLLLPVVTMAVLTLMHSTAAQAARWTPPLRSVTVAREFDFDSTAPFSRGASRGVTLHGIPGAVVRAPCSGSVTFAGRHPQLGGGLTLRCGALLATELGLERPALLRGTAVVAGVPVGRLGSSGRLYLSARGVLSRWGYEDPLALLGDGSGRQPLQAPPPRRRKPLARAPRGRRPSPVKRPAPVTDPIVPPAAWLGLALAGTGAGIGTTLRRRRRSVAARTEVALPNG